LKHEQNELYFAEKSFRLTLEKQPGRQQWVIKFSTNYFNLLQYSSAMFRRLSGFCFYSRHSEFLRC
jgi:hypothetical protein